MDYYIVMAGETKRPYTREEMANMRASGVIRPDAIYWTEGMSEWRSLREFTTNDIAPSIPPILEPPRIPMPGPKLMLKEPPIPLRCRLAWMVEKSLSSSRTKISGLVGYVKGWKAGASRPMLLYGAIGIACCGIFLIGTIALVLLWPSPLPPHVIRTADRELQ